MKKVSKFPSPPPTHPHQAASVEDDSTLLLLWKYLRAWINDSRRFSRKHRDKEREKLFIIGTNTIESKVVTKKSPLGCKRQSGNAQVETASVDGVECAVVSARWSRSRVDSLLSTTVLDFVYAQKTTNSMWKFLQPNFLTLFNNAWGELFPGSISACFSYHIEKRITCKQTQNWLIGNFSSAAGVRSLFEKLRTLSAISVGTVNTPKASSQRLPCDSDDECDVRKRIPSSLSANRIAPSEAS